MSTKDKLINRLKNKPKDFTWDELKSLMSKLGFIQINQGKTSGFRRKFYYSTTKLMISLHKPHPSQILKAYAIEQIIEKLLEEKMI